MKECYLERYRQMGLRIAMYRKLARLTQEQLAEKIDHGASFIAQIETSANAPSLDTLFEIADALGIPADELLRPLPSTYYQKPRKNDL